MKKINPYHILSLSPKEGTPCISLYANTERELISLLGKAEEIGLKAYDSRTLDRILKPVHNYIKSNRSAGNDFPIALFSTLDFSGYASLPFRADPLAVVASSFHIKPLLKWMQREHPFCLLTLMENEAVLFQGSLSHIEEIERLPYRELRTMDGVYNALDRAVYRSIQSSRVPLILAGNVELTEIYKNISGYRATVEDSILDPAVFTDTEKSHRAAIKILEPFLDQKETAMLQSYWAAERSGRASSTLQEIVQLALSKKIKHLFINEKMHVWGKINHSNASFTYSPKQRDAEDDVLDDLAELVLKNNGAVTILPSDKMPNGKAACAITGGTLVSLRMKITAHEIPSETWREQAVS